MTNMLLDLPVVLPQVVDSLQVNLPPEAVTESMSIYDILTKGGWIMVPLALLSILGMYLFVERIITLGRGRSTNDVTERVRAYIQAGDMRGALAFCDVQDTPVARILKQGLERLGRPIAEIQEAVHAAGKFEAFQLQKRSDHLATIAAIAPMLGFLGTVLGMIKAFQQIQNLQGNVNPSILAGGIWEALVTTAAGLLVGILALFAYNFLLSRVTRIVTEMEQSATQFIDLLQEPVPPASVSRTFARTPR